MPDFQIKLAENPGEIESAQRLRFEVFNKEMGKGLESSYSQELDCDSYDAFCDHLLIIDRTKGMTVGTYRFLLRSRLDSQGTFYSENEFDLALIKKLKGEILEMGRSCVHKDYRKNSVVHLLWAGILRYVRQHHVRYIIGCPSLYTRDVLEINKIYALLGKKYFASVPFRVRPQKGREVAGLKEGMDILGEEKKIFLKLPALLRAYLKVGAVVCGAPAVDEAFGTVDFFALLEVSKISQTYLARLRIDSF